MGAIGVVCLLVMFGYACGSSDRTSGSDGSGQSSCYESCQQWNRENPEYYSDPDQCAQDAAQMEEDMTEFYDSQN